MRKHLFLLFSFLLVKTVAFPQQEDTNLVKLSEITIKAFQYNKALTEVPAAVNHVNQKTLEIFGSNSIVSAVNTTPGVRMEERSPGSYRFNIRGSILRSPFGVRNVKVYFNDIPFTDPGGHTYLNQLGYYNFYSLEIIKGPGSSMYGAGTGGAILINSLAEYDSARIFGEYAIGSFGLQNIYGSVTTGNSSFVSKLGYQHQQSDGYRRHSELKRDVITWTGNLKFGEQSNLKTTMLYGDLFYETPGALTLQEFNANPRAARPGGGGFPSAEDNRASIRQRTFLAGVSFDQNITPAIRNNSVAYASFTSLENPTIRNFAKAKEPHTGGRTTFSFNKTSGIHNISFIIGGELQQNFTSVNIFKNRRGEADTLQLSDEIHTRQQFVFAQATYGWRDWELLAGLSLNNYVVRYERNFPSPQPTFKRRFNNETAPRISLSRKINRLLIYTSVSKGFSPPASPELLPSGNNFNFTLQAEEGTNYDIGVKGYLLPNLLLDVNSFYFSLQNTIVQRRDAGGGDFFVNAGKTKQYGVETSIKYPLLFQSKLFRRSEAWLSHTWHRFHYRHFKQLNNDFSGKLMPAVAPHTVSAGYDVSLKNGLLATFNYYYSDKIALNDANTEFAENYHLLGFRIGYELLRQKIRYKLVAGGDNLLNERYSLGNDINGFGGRYYNAASARNYYLSFIVELKTRRDQ
jgi:iron complex outermembrane recepter protein